jgi:hypothetical protein
LTTRKPGRAVLAAVWLATAGWPAIADTLGSFDPDACISELRDAFSDSARLDTAQLEYMVALYSLGRAGEAMDAWKSRANTTWDPDTRVDRLYWLCLTLMENERVGEAASLLEDARSAGLLDRDRSYWHGMAKELLCAAHMELGEFSQAAELAAEVARYDAVSEARILALFDLARAREALRDSAGALEAWHLLASTAAGTPQAVYAGQRLGPTGDSPLGGVIADPVAPDAERVCLHLGSWRSRPGAERWQAAARGAAVDAWVRVDVTPEGPMFTVVAGAFAGTAEAAAAQGRLAASGFTAVVQTPCGVPVVPAP